MGDLCAGSVVARLDRTGAVGPPQLYPSVCWTPRLGRHADRRVVLAIMVLPYIAAVCTDVFRVVPQSQREAPLALAATKWEMVRMAVLPYGASGIIGAIMLGLGRALGEAIAVAIVIGNRPVISASLFAPSSTPWPA